MSRAHIRTIRLKQLQSTHAEDTATKPAWNAIAKVETIAAEIDAKRAELQATGSFTDHGIYEQLKPLRTQHAKALRELQAGLQSSAEELLTKSAGTIELPADSARILTWWQSLPASERNAALVRAMSGKDPELSATLAHSSSERYVNLTSSSLQMLRSKFADADAAADNVPRLAAHQLANEIIEETLPTLEI